MAKSAKRHSKRSKRSHSKRRTHRVRGGVAPLQDNSMLWASKMSMGQGGDYLKYHVGQHGGAALVGADLSHDSMLPSQLRASAHLAGIDRAIAEVQHYKDQAGGRRKRRGSKRSKRSKRSGHKRSKRSGSKRSGHKRSGSKRSGSKRSGSKRSGSKRSHRRRTHRRRGGALGYAPFGAKAMLLSPSEVQQAGLNPHWRDVETEAAKVRNGL